MNTEINIQTINTQAIMDWEREARTGLCEAVYASGKSLACLAGLIEKSALEKRRLLITRLTPEAFASLSPALIQLLNYDALSQTAILGEIKTDISKSAASKVAASKVAIVSAGMADAPVVEETYRSLAFAGVSATRIADVGVAGLWRLMARLEEIKTYSVIIAVAGMEGALFSVLGGLVSAPIIALPTSTGYGVSAGGNLALNSALGSCAPGLVAVNINNGFGAAQAALRILNLMEKKQ